MYYRLKNEYYLRGWDRLPYALVKRPQNTVNFLLPEVFTALNLCDGSINCDLILIPQKIRDEIAKLREAGVIEPCAYGEGLSDDQNYYQYDCRYIGSAHWSITGKCNYRCKHCCMSAPEAKLGELPHDTVMDIIEQLAECGVMRVSLTGGEPLIREDFEEILDQLARKGIWITQIYSNGYLVRPELLTMLTKYGFKPEFNMSYDGNEGWHDWLRGNPQAGKHVLDAFDLCHEHGFPTGAEMCLHQGNQHLLRESLNTLAKHHCQNCKVNRVSASELWQKYEGDYTLELDELYPLFLDYIPNFFEDGMMLSVMLGGLFQCEKGKTDYRIPVRKYDGSDVGRDHCLRQTVCGHARNMLYLSPEGRMLPCLPLSSYDIQHLYPLITEIGLKKGLTESKYMELIDLRLEDFLKINDECDACEYRYICAGGCRASALEFEETNILGTDRAACRIFKGGYDTKAMAVCEKAVAKLSSK